MDEFDYPQYDFDPRNLPSELLRAIGLNVVAATHSEQLLNDSIAGLLGTDVEKGIALNAHTSLPQRASIAISLAEIRFGEVDVVVEFEDIVTRLRDAISARHSAAHDTFVLQLPEKKVVRLSYQARTEVSVTKSEVSIAHLEAQALDIYEAGIALEVFMQRHRVLPAEISSPRRIVIDAQTRKRFRRERRKKHANGS